MSIAVMLAVCGPVWSADNALTDAEKADGWKLLFDGKSLAGWHAGKAPGGSPNKFTVAYKDMPRIGQLALQNHNTKVWFRNIKIKPLPGKMLRDAFCPEASFRSPN